MLLAHFRMMASGYEPYQFASTIKAFDDMDAFIRRHITTQPKPLERALVTELPVTLPIKAGRTLGG